MAESPTTNPEDYRRMMPMAGASSRAKSFHDLPLELRQNIVCYAATDSFEACKLFVTYTLYDITHDKTGRVQSQTLAILDQIRRVGKEIFEVAIGYLTSPRFRWVFVSQAQPHLYLVRTLRKYLHKTILARIKHVSLPHFTVMGHIHPAHSLIERECVDQWEIESMRGTLAYVQRLPQEDTKSADRFGNKVANDVGYSLTLLPHTIPALQRLDIDLDVADCLLSGYGRFALRTIIRLPSSRWPTKLTGGIITPLTAFGNAKTAGGIELHVFWKDSGMRSRITRYKLSDGIAKLLQELFVEGMREESPFKSITSHP